MKDQRHSFQVYEQQAEAKTGSAAFEEVNTRKRAAVSKLCTWSNLFFFLLTGFSPKLVGCSPYVQLQGAGAILGGNCGNCRSQVSPGAPSNPSQLYSPAPSSNKSSVTKAAPFWTFSTQRWQSLAVDKNHWDLGMPALQLSAASLGSIWQIWWQLPTNHWQVSNRSGMGFAQEVTASCKSRGDKQRNPLGLWENRGELWTTAVYGVADGWELTGSVEG